MKNRVELIKQIIVNDSNFKCGNINYYIENEYVIIFEPTKETKEVFYCTDIISKLSPIFSGYIEYSEGQMIYRVH